MGRKVLLTVVCWLTLSQTFGEKKIYGLAVNNIESGPRLYRNVPLGVYASAAPYGAYSFHLPTFVAAPRAAASQVVPVKENFVNRLTDSYGNQFVGTPQLSTYKLSLPQQYIPLQTKLPEHLAQPLVAASANFQFKQSNGQYFGAPYRVPAALQGPAPTPLHHFPNFGQLYGNNVKYSAPNTVTHSQAFGNLVYQQPTSNKAVLANIKSHEQYNHYKEDPKVSQQKEVQIVVGTPKVPGIQEISYHPHGDTKFQKLKEASYSSLTEPKKFAHAYNGDAKFQRIKETSHSYHGEPNYKQQTPQHNHEEVKFERVQELPYYESKYHVIDEQPQLHRIQEHRPSHGEVKFQRIQEAPSITHSQHTYEHSQAKPQNVQQEESAEVSESNKGKLETGPAKQIITYVHDLNGQKTVVELETEPNLPLLDLTLLEPLKFDNPLVPQVQHFLPRISQATYQKLPEFNIPVNKNYQKELIMQKTTSYDSAEGHENPHKDAIRKKQKKVTQQNKYAKKEEAPKKTTVTYHEILDDAPEIAYEINSPNYKETIKEKSVSYNMKTQSEPVHYTYGSKSEKEPVTYSYSRTSNEPAQIKSIQYHGNGPSHLIYKFKPEEPHVQKENTHNSAPHSSEAGNEEFSSQKLNGDSPSHHQHDGHTEQYEKHQQPAEEHYEPVHNQKKNYYKQNIKKEHEVVQHNPINYDAEPVRITSEEINLKPILKQYENNIHLLTPSASIKVDPHQHVQPKSTPQPHGNDHGGTVQTLNDQHPHSSPAPQNHHHSSGPESHRPHYHHAPHFQSYNGPAAHIHERSKSIIIQEEAPDEMHMLRENMRKEIINQEENSEEHFDKAYHDAAIGFPAYNEKASDEEKDIFDPGSYGVPRDHVEYDFDHTPLQQYQADGDDFPKEARSSYKDSRDKLKQNYYTDFSVSKPEGLLDGYQNKLGYYKLYKEQKPDYVVDFEHDKKQKLKSAKYTAAPSFDYQSSQENTKSYYGQPNPKQQLYDYGYSKVQPRDNSAFASRPYQSYKRRTSFVEPQFQYGFEPIELPKLLDSELAAMASNDSPESEKPGMRKKVYKENWYIKKTSTSAGAPAR